MKTINQYITEKLKLKNIKKCNYKPNSREELINILDKLYQERGDNGDYNDIDISNVESLFSVFCHPMYENFDGDLSNWDTSNVIHMVDTFSNCLNFTGKGLKNWDVSKVENMSQMFLHCKKFNEDISNWNVSNVRDMHSIFRGTNKNITDNIASAFVKKSKYYQESEQDWCF